MERVLIENPTGYTGLVISQILVRTFLYLRQGSRTLLPTLHGCPWKPIRSFNDYVLGLVHYAVSNRRTGYANPPCS